MKNDSFSMADLSDLDVDLSILLGGDLPVSDENGVNVVICTGKGRRLLKPAGRNPNPLSTSMV